MSGWHRILRIRDQETNTMNVSSATAWHHRFLRFNSVGLLGVGVQLGAVAVLTQRTGLAPELASVLGVALALVHNFTWHRRWTWADRGQPGTPAHRSFLKFAAANGLVSIA